MAEKDKKFQRKVEIIIAAVISLLLAVFAFLDSKGILTYDRAKEAVGLTRTLTSDSEMSVYFIDVGQGSCALATCGGYSMLIDSGEADQGEKVLSFLKLHDIEKLDCVIGSHPHSDHIGGMKTIVDSGIEIKKIIFPKIPDDMVPTSYIYENLLMSIDEKDIPFEAAKDCAFSLGGAEVRLYVPSGDYDDLNDYSIAVKITHGECSFLMTGDLGKKSEKELVNRGCNLYADVLNVGHHGSKESSSDLFLSKVKPEYCVIQCGADNSYGHPHEEALMRLKKYASVILTAADKGSVVFGSDGKTLNYKTEKG